MENWKSFREEFKNSFPNESQFIVGLDLGNSTSSISYFNLNSKEPELIDISGGYGKPNIPTVIQFVADSHDWVFGEYALLNVEDVGDVKIHSLIEDLGKNKSYVIDGRTMSHSKILGVYIKEILANCKNLNPRANIAGIVTSVPSYIGSSALAELKEAFKDAGYENYLIDFVQDRECILRRYFFKKEVKDKKVLILDFGNRSLEVGAYSVSSDDEKTEKTDIECLMLQKDDTLGEKVVQNRVVKLLSRPLAENIGKTLEELNDIEREQFYTFVYNNKDLLFQKNIMTRPIKFYYNFVHPAFQETYKIDDIAIMLDDFQRNFEKFILKVLDNNGSNNISAKDIDTVICTGGGFEMLWAKDTVKKIFGSDKLFFHKNSKSVISEGASIIAADSLGVIDVADINLIDKNILSADIGIQYSLRANPSFHVIAETSNFWWSDFNPCILLINEDTNKNKNIDITLLKRDMTGTSSAVETITLDNLPPRPKGTTKVKIYFNFIKNDLLKLTVEDYGFGELFPKSDYSRDFMINI